MKIIICASLSATNEILNIKKKLEEKGHEVEIPHGVKNPEVRERIRNRKVVINSEEANEKIKYNVLKKYYELIKQNDVVLVVNPKKTGIEGYIGGNTFLEMGFAHILGKKIFCLYSLPTLSYTAEMMAMNPVVIQGDLGKIK